MEAKEEGTLGYNFHMVVGMHSQMMQCMQCVSMHLNDQETTVHCII